MRKSVKDIISVMTLSVIGRGSGFVREVVIAIMLGTTAMADAYTAAFSIPCVLVSTILTAVSTVFIPRFKLLENVKGESSALRFTNTLLVIVLFLCAIICLCGMFFTDSLVRLFVGGFNQETIGYTVYMCRGMFVCVLFQGVNAVLTGYLQSQGKFSSSTIVTLPFNTIMIISLALYARAGMLVLVFGCILGVCSQALLLGIMSRLAGWKVLRSGLGEAREVKNALLLSLPIALVAIVQELNSLVDKFLASSLQSGSVAGLNYAYKLNGFIYAIVSLAIATVIFPMLSEKIAKKDITGFYQSINGSLTLVTTLLVPITCFMMSFSGIITSALFGHGAFDSASIEITRGALFFYSIGTLFLGYREILSRAFFAQSNTRAPAINSAICVALNIVFSILFTRIMQLNGIALATSLSGCLTAVFLYFLLKRHNCNWDSAPVRQSIVHTLIASLPIIIFGIFFNYIGSVQLLQASTLNQLLFLGISGITLASIFFLILWLLGDGQAMKMVSYVRSRLRSSK